MAKLKPRSYLELFSGGRMLRTTIGGFFARFFMGLVSLALLSMYTMSGYSYTIAGIAIGIVQLASFFIGPRVSRMIDRKGQTKVMPLATVLGMGGLAATMLIIHFRGPEIAAILTSILIGFTPQVMSLTRARWSYVLRKDDDREGIHLKTAFSLEGMLDDFSFMIGPALAILISAQLFPEAGLLFGMITYIIGVAIMLTDRTCEPDVEFMEAAAQGEMGKEEAAKIKRKSVFIAYPIVTVFFIAMIFQGGLFGFFDPATYGMAAEIATEELAGPAFMAGTGTSMVVVFLFGMFDWKASPLKRILIMGTLFGIVYLPAAIATNLPLLYASHAFGAISYGPLSITQNQILEQTVSPSRLTESLTWLGAGMQLGMAAGPTIVGFLIDAFGAQAGLIATSACGLCVPIIFFACLPILRKALAGKNKPAEPEPAA